MKAIRVHDFGGPEALEHEEVPRPEPSDEEVLVRAHAAGVNPIDWLVRSGGFSEIVGDETPWIPGWDVSGVVERVGSGVAEFEEGDEVYGMADMPGRGETYAEYVSVPEDCLVPVPDSLDLFQAAGVPMVSQTAWYALFDEGGLESNQRVLVHGAAGGVGHMAVQFAKVLGAEVIGTGSEANREYLVELGVDRFVNYRTRRFEEEAKPVDVVLDTVGGEVLERSAEVLKPNGRLVTLPEEPSETTKERMRDVHGVEPRFFSIEPDKERMEGISSLIGSQKVEPYIQEVIPLSEAQRAHRESEAGHVRGKLVLDNTDTESGRNQGS